MDETKKGLVPINKTAVRKALSPSAEYNTLDKRMEVAEYMVKSKLVPFKNPADVVLVIEAAQSIGMPIPFALANFYSVNGKLSAGVHVKTALCHKGSVTFETVENFEPVMHYLLEGGFKIAVSREQYQKEKLYPMSGSKWSDMTSQQRETLQERLRKEGKKLAFKVSAPFIDVKGWDDHRTTIKATRVKKLADGTFATEETQDSYYLHEAFKAGYFAQGKEKDNWILHTKAMLMARCKGRVIDQIASDIVFNLQTFEEFADEHNIEYELDEENRPTIKSFPEDATEDAHIEEN